MLDESVVRLKSLTPVQSCSFNHLQSISKQGSSDISSKGTEIQNLFKRSEEGIYTPKIPIGNPAEESNFPDEFPRNRQGFVSSRKCFTFNHTRSSSVEVSKNRPFSWLLRKSNFFSIIITCAQMHHFPEFHIPWSFDFCFVFCSVSGRQWNLLTYQLPGLQASVAQLSRLSTIIISFVYIKFHFAFQPQL